MVGIRKFIILFAFVAAVAAQQVSNEYLPPHFDLGGASYTVTSASAPEASYAAESYDVGASAPAHSFSEADGYRYKTQRRRVFRTARRHRRDVSTEYLPPAASAVSTEYLPPAASAPAVSYAAPAASYESYDVGASAPAHSFSEADGYRYKTQRRRVFGTARRHRRDVSTEYLPPAASAVSTEYLPPAASAPAVSYAAPAASYESYDVSASAPAHSYSEADGYRYKTQRRRVFRTARRHRRDVSTEYLPPAASAVSTEYLPPAASAPAVSYAAPAASYESYDVSASAPAHSFSEADGYRYKTQRRRVFRTARRHRRDVSTEYLPPAASAPVASYESYETAPAASYESYEVAAAPAAHSFSEADGYRYKTQRRRVFRTARRHRRDVSTEYLPPAASAVSTEYLPPAASAPAVSYAAPAASYESYDVSASAPAHSFSEADGYRYKTQRRRVFRTARRHRF
ncbi:uncharacterized protein LOC133325713 [Musca vetustissima]|uniref:uncharacterized protein LOC133325713 n=1 Tax=Musca vetustissima TaxID=27455 RepID=UPI002AB6B157|nr:uncharacterized protein LOC133325713 [Musca vetustissima]